MGRLTIRTFGHGTATADQIVEILRDAGVTSLVDVRRYPGSRRHPHVARESMEVWVADGGIAYRWDERLGGRRKVHAGSHHVALRNDQFRAYADHMETDEFEAGVGELLDAMRTNEGAGDAFVAVMCSESVWWRCHRRLLSDHLVLVEGVEVGHVMHDGSVRPHAVTDGARLDGRRVLYDGGQAALL